MRLLLLLFLFAAEDRNYHLTDLGAMAAAPADSAVIQTHVRVTGLVTLVKQEGDGDTHIRLNQGDKFIVAECIPQMPCKKPKVGQTITVWGISRYDTKHKWHEVHPVEKLEVSLGQ